MKIYSMIVVTERQSRTRLFVDIPTNHKLVIVFSIIRKATPCNKLKKNMPQIRTDLYFYLQRNANVQQHAHVLVLHIYINQNWLLKIFSLSLLIFFLHVNVTN